MADQFRFVENPDPRVWDDFVCAQDGHLLQSSAWGELKTRFGWTATRLALERGGTLTAAAQILFRRLPLGLQLAYVPRGPVVDPSDGQALTALVEALAATARAHGAFALKLEPNWLDDQFAGGLPMPLRGCRPGTSHQPQTTIHIDLARDFDAILAQMKPKWRYNIRLSARKGVSVREGTTADLPLFYRLLQVTSARDRFAIHSLAYYRTAFELLREHARLFIAEFRGEPLAAIFVTAFGRQAIYLYGASSNEHRECMPNHALHWAAIQWARARGCACYDLWGIADDRPVTKGERRKTNRKSRITYHASRITSHVSCITHHLPLSSFILHPRRGPLGPSSLPEGLYQFKHGFGGNVVRYVGAYDKVFSPARFKLYTRALAFRRGSLI